MKTKILTATAILYCFVVCFAIIADISGKWTGILQMQNGNGFPVNYTFKVDGDKLTGVATAPQGDVAITDGKMTGTDFTFSLAVNGGNVKHSGKYYTAGDTIGMDVDFNGKKVHTTLKRSDK